MPRAANSSLASLSILSAVAVSSFRAFVRRRALPALPAVAALLPLLWAGPAEAARVQTLSPQGEVARVRQVAITFDSAMLRFGDARAAAPADVACRGASVEGQGRWINDKRWVYDFARDLPPGMQCAVTLTPGLKDLAGTAVSGQTRYSFQTGGPAVVSVRPGGGEVEEQPYFAIRFNGAATPASVRASSWCQAEGLGERVPVKLIEGKDRDAIVAATHWTREAQAANTVFVLACQQRLPAGAKMELVIGRGVATPSGLASRDERRLSYTVREPFTASFSCERENAQAPCTPLRPMRLSFSSPIATDVARKLEVRGASGKVAASIERDAGDTVQEVTFPAPFAERAEYTLDLPRSLKDDSGRALANADLFPLKTTTAALSPLAKFAAAPFGVVERFADVPRKSARRIDAATRDAYPPLLPLTLRNVEADLAVRGVPAEGGMVARLQVDDDAAMLRWYALVKRLHESSMTRPELERVLSGLDPSDAHNRRNEPQLQARAISLLDRVQGVKKLALPKGDGKDPRPFEVVGIPLPEPGFHVVEVASPRLGGALLGKAAPMYVRTAVLVTNLGVHFKVGRDNALAWVTTLDDGKPVANARVHVLDCNGRSLAAATTDQNGIARIDKALGEGGWCRESGLDGYFVTARIGAEHPQAAGKADVAFVMSNWTDGIEAWRFNVPTDHDPKPTQRVHTVFDRMLFRAGETVSMKHLIRQETRNGLALPTDPATLPDKLVVRHMGSNQKFEQPVVWRTTPTGGRSADNTLQLPAAAKLGVYEVTLSNGEQTYEGGTFRVEAFRLPVLGGTLTASGKSAALIAPKQAPVDVQINYLSGGGAAQLPVQVSAVLRDRSASFDGYDGFAFGAPQEARRTDQGYGDEDEEDSGSAHDPTQQLVADKLKLVLDRNGAGQVTLKDLPAVKAPRTLMLEASFSDPNGEIQTLRQNVPVWPAAIVPGIRASRWVSVQQDLAVQAVALDTSGKPRKDAALEVRAVSHITTSNRKRLVGGFYSYDNRTETRDLGKVCEGKTDAQGLLNCNVALKEAGEIELIVAAKDDQGNTARAATSVWVTRQGDVWFGGGNNDRIDLLPERKTYAPGETATFQVRMPFRYATALVAVEREGIIETQVVELNGKDPTVRLKVQPQWGPNVYVSVLALRGRLREVPWYSFFTWGWRQPGEWFRAFRSEGREYVAPTALVDLSKPAFRLGLAEIRVGTDAHRIDVKVATDKTTYPVRGTARVTITGTLPDGKPAANAEVAVAAVDQALLELMPNSSWNLLDAMFQRRSYGVDTATAQMEIIGRRHYGRKAVPAGGGGGKNPTRELFDTLLVWQPNVRLDAQGRATLEVPLNDSLTRFTIVAVADAGVDRFGTGTASIAATQDLQLISGLPPLVRENDRYRAMFTLRNTTQQAMNVEVTARGTLLGVDNALPAQTVAVPAGAAREIVWDVTAPAALAFTRSGAIHWEIAATDKTHGATDRLKVTQTIVPAVPVTVQQATLERLAPGLELPVAMPQHALADTNGVPRGGLQLDFQSKLADGLPGVTTWFRHYPFTCLEQKASRAIGLRDATLWNAVAGQLPAYLDSDGLASYFPPSNGGRAQGSEVLTAYLLAAAHEAARAGMPFKLPEEARRQMEQALTAFVEGRIRRDGWSPRADNALDRDVRKLAALEALSRSGAAQARMLGSIAIAPNTWPTSAVLDWYALLLRLPDIPQHAKRQQEAEQILRARLTMQGTRLAFSTERDDNWWWLMQNADTNAARLLALVLDQPAWRDDVPRLATGLLARQVRGAWSTTTANLWGSLAIARYSQTYERTPVGGSTQAQFAGAEKTWSWPAATGDAIQRGSLTLPWPVKGAPAGSAAGTAASPLRITHQGSGQPWVTVSSLAAVPLTQPFAAGYRIRRTVAPVEQAVKGKWTRGDIARVTLEIEAQTDMNWVAVSDPIPAGATILGSGLGRDSAIASSGERRSGAAWLAYTERAQDAYREYYEVLPKGSSSVEYTVRLNNAGDFALPPTRVEALYAPDVYGEIPNARMTVAPKAP